MLTIARESRRMSQTALAKASGLSQAAVSQYESGAMIPTEEAASRLATPLGYPQTLFGVSVRFQQLPVTFFRKRAKVGIRDVNAIRARVNLYRLRLEILLRAAELRDARIALTDLAEEGLDPEAAARRLRTYWSVPPGPVKNLTAIIEAAGILVIPIDFGNASVDGLSIFEPSDNLPPMIFLNHALSADRWRLTLAHELGHIALHHHLSIPPDPKRMEDEGYRFAQEFLAPAREVAGHLGYLNMTRLASLKLHWGVSMRAILKRAESLGRISDRQARRLWMQLSRDGQTEAVTIPDERPTLLRSLVEKHLGELEYSVEGLSAMLHQKSDEFRSEFGLSATRLRLV
jgi:Zn-dependent peptidase ImmA (M78 family)